MEEKLIWKGSPSQWINNGMYIFAIFFFWLIIPLLLAIWYYLEVKFWTIKITSERMIEEKGVLSKSISEVELYRVKDIKLEQPFLFRLVGLSNILLFTSDKTHSIVKIPAVKDGKELREKIRAAVDVRRDIKKVRELDYQ